MKTAWWAVATPEQIVHSARVGIVPNGEVSRADVEAAYAEADKHIIDAAAARFRKHPGRWDAAEMSCWDKAEADRLRAYAESKHPEIRWIFSWREFDRA